MALSRIYVDEQTDRSLTNLQGRTGLRPNVLCRLGLCFSLGEPGVPDPQLYQDGSAREFNLTTLTGHFSEYFFALVRERLHNDKLDIDEHFEPQFKAHLSRGVVHLDMRVQNLEDIAKLVSQAQARAKNGESDDT